MSKRAFSDVIGNGRDVNAYTVPSEQDRCVRGYHMRLHESYVHTRHDGDQGLEGGQCRKQCEVCMISN